MQGPTKHLNTSDVALCMFEMWLSKIEDRMVKFDGRKFVARIMFETVYLRNGYRDELPVGLFW